MPANGRSAAGPGPAGHGSTSSAGGARAQSRADAAFIGPPTAAEARARATAKMVGLRDNVRAPRSLPRNLADQAIKPKTRAKYKFENIRTLEWLWAMAPEALSYNFRTKADALAAESAAKVAAGADPQPISLHDLFVEAWEMDDPKHHPEDCPLRLDEQGKMEFAEVFGVFLTSLVLQSTVTGRAGRKRKRSGSVDIGGDGTGGGGGGHHGQGGGDPREPEGGEKEGEGESAQGASSEQQRFVGGIADHDCETMLQSGSWAGYRSAIGKVYER